jgi:hypothetical protein
MIKQPCDEGVVLGASLSAACRQSDRPWILAATILGSSLVFIDGTVVAVALPAPEGLSSRNSGRPVDHRILRASALMEDHGKVLIREFKPTQVKSERFQGGGI